MAGWWDDLTTQLGEFTSNPDRMSATFGQAAQAIAPQGTWQHGLGKAAAGMGRANIKADAAQTAAEERKKQIRDLISALAGEGPGAFSDKEIEGPTSLKMDGNKATLEANIGGAGPLESVSEPKGTLTPQAARTTSVTPESPSTSQPGAKLNLTDILPFLSTPQE
jgi:hypothetical protein